jgi:3-oxoacyl-[acyl-carrier protein] reductase
MKVDLAGKVALVTGAARGIGQAISDALVANGATVIYTDVDAAAVEAAAAKTSSLAMAMNITDVPQVEAVVDKVISLFGKIDILVNNAGVNTLKHRVTIDQFPLDEWNRIVHIDLTGSYIVSQKVSAAMVAKGAGRIINIASIVGLVPLRLQCAFTAAKAGLVNLTKAMALELAPKGILVNGVAPGSIMTDGTKALFYGEDGKFKDSVQKLLDHIPLGRPGTAAEIAHAVLYLADPDNTYVNGHILTVDGGWTAGYAREF